MGRNDVDAIVVFTGLLIVAPFLYFLPLLIADARRHGQLRALALLNALGGWTGIGWIAALLWAVAGSQIEPLNDLLPCPLCAVPIRPGARSCRFCLADLPEGWETAPAAEDGGKPAATA